MGAVPSRFHGYTGGAGSQHSGIEQDNDNRPIIEKDDSRRYSSVDTVHCPTCLGTGRIPRGQESKLVAVIPCNDQRLSPRHTKLYVAVSVGVCLLVSSLVLFFLFPRSVLISPVAVKSSFVYFTEADVQINITYSFVIPIKLTDPDLSDYCRKEFLPVNILYLHLQMSMTVYYLAHYEQLSLETYEYIDCGANSTVSHSLQPTAP
ncbi:transmembrane protein 106A-like isoform X3 [Cottoperca gobio]|uniref:Transmembrane protein 106A-like isoform X3 n=1 Tax=Cottoperca gobio TaxID=56716 RepID=A0A6J2QAB3_COTGO|nr:transmembrane protein 106A-like isoform X3 [Cottoperca gobio]